MECLELRQILLLYVDNELSPAQARAIRRHLDLCPPCRRRAEYEERFQAMLRENLAPHPAPPGLRERICESLADRGLSRGGEEPLRVHLRGHLVCVQCENAAVPLACQKECVAVGHRTGMKVADGRVLGFVDTDVIAAIVSDPDLRGREVEVEGALYPRITTLEVSVALVL